MDDTQKWQYEKAISEKENEVHTVERGCNTSARLIDQYVAALASQPEWCKQKS